MKPMIQALTDIQQQQQQQQDRKEMVIDMPIKTRALPASQRFAWGSRTRYVRRTDASAREQNALR